MKETILIISGIIVITTTIIIIFNNLFAMSYTNKRGNSFTISTNKRSKIEVSSNNNQITNNNCINILSWNVDGLNKHMDIERSLAITNKITQLNPKPDIIHLQEITSDTINTFLMELGKYNYFVCDNQLDLRALPSYFTLAFYYYPKIKIIDYNRQDFTSNGRSQMGRSMELSTIELVSTKSIVNLINLHLESTGSINTQYSLIRKAQFKEVLSYIISFNDKIPSILSGDLNIRVQEAKNVINEINDSMNSKDSLVYDAFEVVKGQKASGNTWFLPGDPKVSARYDRIYYNQNCIANSLDIIGDEVIPWLNNAISPYSTLSDHRGLLSTIIIK